MLSRIGVVLVAAALSVAVPAAAEAAALRAPSGGSPAGGASGDAVPPFTWRAVRGAAQYEFQVAADKRFGSLVKSGSFRTRNTAATLRASLADGTYYWRVRGIRANNDAGHWSAVRSFDKAWTTAPNLLEPEDALSIQWPTQPLVLRWSPVAHATKYIVTVATDPSLANPLLGTATKPVETQGTVLALPGALAPGSYHWAVTPVDEGGFKGSRSRVGSFSWGWPTQTDGRVLDLDPSPGVFDPLLQWNTVPGAAKYEVEVNPTSEFTPGSRVFAGIANGTSIAPTLPLRNNTYHWRFRAVDANANAGVWNVGAAFKKEFDDVTPTIRNVRIRDHDSADLGGAPATTEPFFTWDPVPGATRYELQFTEFSPAGSGFCDWSRHFGEDPRNRSAFTDNNAWAAGTGGATLGRPGPLAWGNPVIHANPFASGGKYCMRLLAQDGARNASEWTYVNGVGQPTNPNRMAFSYTAPALPGGTCPPPAMPETAYREPAHGSFTPRTPFFTWDPVPGAASYFVVVARDAEFTEVVDFAFTRLTIYAPRKTYADETTSYYWAVIPAGSPAGLCTDTIGAIRAFQKRSRPPEPIGPANGEDVPIQPLFRWSAVESAAVYRLQVSSDPGFGRLIDDATTASTAYAATKAYPADTRLYWRVRANTLNWSETRSFRRRLPAPTLTDANPTGGETIPVLGWNPVNGAVSYELHVDQADGTRRDFSMRSTRFTPTLFYGTGVWRWKVRATFPGNVFSAYSPSQEYVRRLNAPAAVRVTLSRDRMLFSWAPDQAAAQYRLELSEDDSFVGKLDIISTPLTAWAPTLTKPGYTNGGRLWWRLAVVDQGRNVGAYTTGIVALPRAMTVKARGALRRRRRGTLTITVRDMKDRPVRKALVTVSGAGAKARGRTGKKGVVRLRVRPRKRGAVIVRAKLRGFRTAQAKARVR